ncbi:hypothetical protein G7B40_039340 [Aetokthonos hydrillicola Thurmond2011]|jgi:hypothetical protein|uniref:Uncharacterized protein n=1 Tax=Aetokthonos hydrillicola Thurmond2011 TaxID=2712845 RepID=A0AAP5IGG6_9CYAN|nr:hypothetical protein [Aetokthonos hydrillicola]MBO3463466.1 hypothetical protein [Aetokthonos hydrillicola CCALA 1050]MBW4591156.1 hypothetical protein [Aetokthonos hydrillicola CCALA 1050]MDR9900547.1 hypothetical protein [Aetokthonos hydrillicola Thurmond2011]
MLQEYTTFTPIDEQTTAQAELDSHIEAQAQEIAPEPEIQFIDLDGFYTYEAQLAGQVIATITHDCEDFVTQPWVVMVGEVEVHRADTWANCANYIQWHYKQGTLAKLRTTSLEKLLDKPFDELSTLDWQRLKDYEPHSAELLAA